VRRRSLLKLKQSQSTPIIFGNFEAALEDIVNGGALSLSMATANMVKGWSTEVCQFEYTHVCMAAKARDPPMDEEQAAKTCTKVPGNLQMKNMRPISLYEVIRKVWITTISNKIFRVL
jgi:hypothetical protein